MASSSSSAMTEMHLSSPLSSDSSLSSLSDSPSPKEEEGTNELYSQMDSQLDPFTYLLQSDAMTTEDLTQPSVVNDWSSFISLADGGVQSSKTEAMDLGGEFNFTMPMDMGLESAFIDPSTLHFNTSIFTQPDTSVHAFDPSQTDLVSSSLTQLVCPNGLHPGRRLSVTSSSSGASLSPILEQRSAPTTSATIPANSHEELAQKILQAIGATLTVPSDTSSLVANQSKLPIPRLGKQATETPAPAKSSVVSQLSPESSPPSSSNLSTTIPGRPKTGHTIIERRYRTNLNARITNLKQSVPALRVLEARLNGKDTSPGDTVDERGFVDGVKVGRKMSKANILGKATEYIRVLKRREARVKREQAGLKSLISGLVNGPALLEAWETQWREMFGGEEKDEVEDEPGSDEEDGDVEGEGEDDEEDPGRARKRARTVKTAKQTKVPSVLPATPKATTVTTTPTVLPEKRKRGRPRKIPLPTPTPQAAIPMMANAPQQSSQQYLLAAFAFLSFFNSPLTTYSAPYSHRHEHTGSVLNHITAGKPPGYGWNDLIQAFHLLVSAALFFSIIIPWLPGVFRNSRFIAKLASPFIAIYPTYRIMTLSATPTLPEDRQETKQPTSGLDVTRSALLNALSSASRGSDKEAQLLRKALGISVGLIGLCQGVSKAGKKHRGIELDQLEQRGWVRLGELVALDGSVSLSTRLLTYWGMSWHISTFSASAVDLVTLSLIIRPVSGSRASYLWEQARRQEILRPHEKLVLDSMDACEAASLVQRWERSSSQWTHYSPLAILAETLVRRKVKKHARLLFVQSVDKAFHDDDSSDTDESTDGRYLLTAGTEAESEVERLQVIQAGKSLGGSTADLAVALEKVWDLGTFELPSRTDADYEDVRALLSAIALYREVFRTSQVHAGTAECTTPSISVILTPPSSPSPRNVQAHQALRKALGASAFEMFPDADGDQELDFLAMAVENARDSVVDMLVDLRAAGCRVHF